MKSSKLYITFYYNLDFLVELFEVDVCNLLALEVALMNVMSCKYRDLNKSVQTHRFGRLNIHADNSDLAGCEEPPENA